MLEKLTCRTLMLQLFLHFLSKKQICVFLRWSFKRERQSAQDRFEFHVPWQFPGISNFGSSIFGVAFLCFMNDLIGLQYTFTINIHPYCIRKIEVFCLFSTQKNVKEQLKRERRRKYFNNLTMTCLVKLRVGLKLELILGLVLELIWGWSLRLIGMIGLMLWDDLTKVGLILGMIFGADLVGWGWWNWDDFMKVGADFWGWFDKSGADFWGWFDKSGADFWGWFPEFWGCSLNILGGAQFQTGWLYLLE